MDTWNENCNDICLSAADIDAGGSQVAYAHPDCEAHGHAALYETDGTLRVDGAAFDLYWTTKWAGRPRKHALIQWAAMTYWSKQDWRERAAL